MGYLICDSCKGYYELKSGESPEDFLNECDCGGTLKFKESLDLKETTDNEVSDSREISDSSEVSDSREPSHINETYNNKETSDFGETSNTMEIFNTQETSNTGEVSKIDFRIIRLIIGVLIVLIPNFLYNNSTNILFLAFSGIPLILGGFISSIFTEEISYKDGILNGARVGLFSGIIYLVISLIVALVYSGFTGNIASAIGIFLISFLVLILLTSLGGFLGFGTRLLIVKLEKMNEHRQKPVESIETDDIIETDASKEIQDEENRYRDELIKLGFKQMTAINDGEKVFNCLISDSISEDDAILRLEDDQKIVYEVLTEMKKITPPDRYREYHNLKMESSTDICKTFEIIDGLVKNDLNKIQKTNNLVENSTVKINQAISELHRTMWEEDPLNEFK